jgi:hypothetical protein
MKMAEHTHSTPLDAVTEVGSGNYDMSLYYLMASSMGTTTMGTWSLSVDCGGGDVGIFYPKVTMKMVGTALTTFKGTLETDQISVHSHDTSAGHAHEARAYYVFPEKLQLGSSGNNLTLFAAAKESLDAFPALGSGNTLNAGTGHALTLTHIQLGLTHNGTTYHSQELGHGHFIFNNILGITSGNLATFSVNLQVNDTFKTTDSFAPSANNIQAEITVMPSSMGM